MPTRSIPVILIVAAVASLLLALALPRAATKTPSSEVDNFPLPFEVMDTGPATQADLEADFEDGWWQPAGFGFRMPAPECWVVQRHGGRAYLKRDPEDLLAGNFNALSVPNMFTMDLEGMEEQNRVELESGENFELISIGVEEHGGREVVFCEFNAASDSPGGVRMTSLGWVRDGFQFGLTVAVRAEDWPEMQSEIEDCLARIEFL